MEGKHNRLVGKKMFSLFSWNNIQNISIFSDTYKGAKISTFHCFMWYAIKQFLSLVRQKAFSLFTHFTHFFFSVRQPVPNTIIPHIIHYFAEFRTFFLLRSSGVGLSFADRPLLLVVVFPALRRACAIFDRKMKRVLHLLIPRCELWRRYRSHACTTDMSSKWNTMR
jgi:hypothetical protein